MEGKDEKEGKKKEIEEKEEREMFIFAYRP